jgi:uncharacterized protein YwgA
MWAHVHYESRALEGRQAMDRQQVGLKLALDALGIPIRLGSFDDRLTLQKAIYLAQAAGVQLGYHYNWYLRGPYSPGLTRDAFAIHAELAQNVDDSQGSTLDPTSLDRLRKVRERIEQVERRRLPFELELLASVRFLQQSPAARSSDASGLRAILNRFGKSYSVEQIQHAVEELKQYGLCPGNSSP